jgi:uroporphyrinogen decarboxylase
MATDLEVFWDTVNHRRSSRVLFSFGCVEDLEKRLRKHVGGDGDYGKHYGMFMQAPNGMRVPEDRPKLDFSKYWEGQTLPEGTVINEAGVAMVPSGFYHFWGYISPLRNATSLKEIEEFPMDHPQTWDFSGCAEAVKKAHAEGKVVSGWAGHMYECAWQFRGYEQFLMDMIERPAWAQCLLDRLAEHNLHRAVQFAKAGVDMITTGDDVANQKSMMFQPSMWREMMHSRWAKTWDTIHRINPKCQIWYHSDGNIIDVIPDLVDAGLNILNPLQPECLDIDKVYKDFGHILSFDGTIGTQSTMPWGTPADVRARVREVIEKYGKNGGLFISPTHVLEPEVPLANIDALVAAVKEFGGNG